MPNPMSTHTPTFTGGTPFAVQYVLSYYDVCDLLHEMNDTSFTSAVSRLFTDPIENVISLVYYPVNMNTLFPSYRVGRGPITISKCTLQTEGSYLPHAVAEPLSLGQVGIGRYFNNFLDFAPYTKIEIYLPFIGFETLDVDLVMGKSIRIEYVVDTYTGKCTAYVILIRSGGAEEVILTRDGQCGQQIQVAGGSGADIARNLLKFGASAIMGAANTAGFISGANPASAIKTAVGFLASTSVGALDAGRFHVQKGGTQETLTASYGPLIAYLIITRPTVAEPSSYAHNYGRPCGKTLTLSACSGFTQVDAVHVEGSGFATATIGERDEIERLLKTGVIL